MPDDNRFAGLSQAADEESVPEPSETAQTQPPEPTPDPEPEPEEDEGGPWFTSEEAEQISAYPHEDTWRNVKLLLTELDVELEGNYDLENIQRRELYDAMFRTALDNRDEVIEHVLDARNTE